MRSRLCNLIVVATLIFSIFCIASVSRSEVVVYHGNVYINLPGDGY